MTHDIRSTPRLVLVALLAWTAAASGQTLRVSFDDGVKAERAAGRADPWVSKEVESVPGKFGKGARLGPKSQLVYAGEENVLAGRGTVAFWCKIPERPGPLDIQRLVFVQCKERGYWNYLATMEWQEGVFRAMVFDFYHGHGWHDPDMLPAFKVDAWHHVALAWDQALGVKFYLDGKFVGSTLGKQAWWERPTPHAVHLCYPGATYDELCVYDRPLTDGEVASLARDNKWELPAAPAALDEAARRRLADSLNIAGPEKLPTIDLGSVKPGSETVIRQATVRRILDDRIPAWKVMDGRSDLFWPEWRSPTLGDVDFSGSEIRLVLETNQQADHLVLRGLVGGCRVHGERDGFVSRKPVAEVPTGLHFLAAEKVPADLTGLRVPRREGMKLQEIGLFRVSTRAADDRGATVTPITGELSDEALGSLATRIRTTTLPHERRILGKTPATARKTEAIAGLSRVHLVTEPVAEVMPLDAVSLRVTFKADWKEDVWWLRIQDPVNPRRDLINVPVRVLNPDPGKETTLAVTLDFWDVMLDASARLWVEVLPTQPIGLVTGGDASRLALRTGERAKVLKEFAHTQSQLALNYWQLGSEADGRQGWNPEQPSFNLLGGITQNHELWLTMQWVRRHVSDNPLVNGLWSITHEKRTPAPVKPRLQPEGAPEWAVWSRELLERYRSMSHKWADWQGPDGQVGGGWNDDTDFPGVFICLPLMGDTRTQKMFTRIYDGLEKTGYLHNGVSRGPIDTRHAADFLSWRAHLMLFDYGQPRHVERGLDLTRELHRWTRLDEKGHRRGVTNHYSEDGPERRLNSKVNDDGSVEQKPTDGDFSITPLLMDSMFCAWYSRNPTVLKFVKEVAEGEQIRVTQRNRYTIYPFVSFAQLFNDPRYHPATLEPYRLTDAEQTKTVQGIRAACEMLEGGWQFRGGEARGANDHFSVPGLTELSRLYLGYGMNWLRPATMMIPPVAVSWEAIDDRVAALVSVSSSKGLRLTVYNFDPQPRTVTMRVWRLESGRYRLRTGIKGQTETRELTLHRSSPVELTLPSQKEYFIELEQIEARPRPERLPDLAVGDGDICYDVATDRLKVVVHNLGSAPAKDVLVRFEDSDGNLLARRTIAQLDAPLDLHPKTTVVWMPQPTLHPVERIIVRIDPQEKIEEITKENNRIVWKR